jgi:hypothetical protein
MTRVASIIATQGRLCCPRIEVAETQHMRE